VGLPDAWLLRIPSAHYIQLLVHFPRFLCTLFDPPRCYHMGGMRPESWAASPARRGCSVGGAECAAGGYKGIVFRCCHPCAVRWHERPGCLASSPTVMATDTVSSRKVAKTQRRIRPSRPCSSVALRYTCTCACTALRRRCAVTPFITQYAYDHSSAGSRRRHMRPPSTRLHVYMSTSGMG
jgi:hypothetical protein